MSELPLYSAKMIAAVLGVTPQAVRQRLARVAPDGQVIVSGNATNAWRLKSLPESLLKELQPIARNRGCPTVEALFQIPETPAPLPPLSQYSPDELAAADKLRRALLPALERKDNPLLTPGELDDILVRNYELAFGHTVTAKHARNLLNRVVDRDQGRGQWQRIDLYVSEQPTPKRAPQTGGLPDFMIELGSLFEKYAKATEFGIEQRDIVWDALFRRYDDAINAGLARRKVRRTLIDLVIAHLPRPRMGKTPRAVEAAFDAWLKGWYANGKKMPGDGRLKPKPPKHHKLTEEEERWLKFYCSNRENANLGYEDFLRSDHATPETKNALCRKRTRSRPQMPKWVRALVTVPTRVIPVHIRGKRSATLGGAYIPRDPNSLKAGESYQSDDKTLDLYWYDEDQPEPWFGQGQFLLWIDERSWLPLAYDLISDGAYTGFSIRNSFSQACLSDGVGLPTRRVYVENGLWRDAKVWAGRRISRDQYEVGIEETEKGIRGLGIDLRHALYPRGKVIERVFGNFTDLITGLPGYAGRNQIVDKWDDVQKRVQLVKAGKEHPGKWFLSKQQLLVKLDEVLHRFSHTPLYGKYHRSLTPMECYQKHHTQEKKTPVTPEILHLIQGNQVQATVRPAGIKLTYGRREFLYSGRQLGHLIGETVVARFLPNDPRILTVKHKSLRSPVLVELVPEVSHFASPEEMRQANGRVAAMNSFGKDLYRSLKHEFDEDFRKQMFRTVIVDKATVEEGRRIRERQAELDQAESASTRQLNRVRRKARRAGMPLDLVNLKDLDGAEQSLDLMLEGSRATPHRNEEMES
jgi:hypothetical protein